MADLLFGLPWVRRRRTRIYQYSDSILIYSNQKLRSRHRFGRASIEYNTNLIKAGLQRKTNCYYFLKPIDQVLIALQVYVNGGLLQVVGDTTGVDKSTVSLAVHNADTILETSRENALWDTNCRLARQYKWFLHHVLTVNQRLTNLLSNRALNNVLNSSD